MPDPNLVTTARRGVVSSTLGFMKAHPKTVLIIAAVAILAAVIVTHL